MKQEGYRVAVLGAAGLFGREICSVLQERQFPVAELRLFESLSAPVGAADDVWGLRIGGYDEIDFSDVDLVFLCAPVPGETEQALAHHARTAVTIDVAHAIGDRSDVPVVVPEVDPEAAAEYDESGRIANPVPGAIALSVLSKPLEDAFGLRRILMAAYEPVSSLDLEAIEVLAQQSRDLLSGRTVETAEATHRLAFNLIPQIGDFLGAGKSRGEWLVESQTRRVLDLPDLPLSVTSVVVPTFHGSGYVVNVETEQPVDAPRARDVLRSAPGMILDEEMAATYATLAETVDTDATHVGRVREDPTVPCGLNLWLTIDGMRKGGAVNAVQIAELLVRDHL